MSSLLTFRTFEGLAAFVFSMAYIVVFFFTRAVFIAFYNSGSNSKLVIIETIYVVILVGFSCKKCSIGIQKLIGGDVCQKDCPSGAEQQ